MSPPGQSDDPTRKLIRTAVGCGLALVIVGTGWLLTVMKVVPGVNWVWIAALALTGLMPIATAGLNKVTAFGGVFMIVASFASLLRQMDVLSINHEVPGLVIAAGILLVLVAVLPIRQAGGVPPSR